MSGQREYNAAGADGIVTRRGTIMPEGRRRIRSQRPDLAAAAEERAQAPASKAGGSAEYRTGSPEPVLSKAQEAALAERREQFEKDLEAETARWRRELDREREGRERLDFARRYGVPLDLGTAVKPAVTPSFFVEIREQPRIEVREGTTYGRDPSVSWVLDNLVLSMSTVGGAQTLGARGAVPLRSARAMPTIEEARTRSERYLAEIGYEIRQRTAEGSRYRSILSDFYRESHGSAYDRSGEALRAVAFNDFADSPFAASLVARQAMPAHMAAEFRAVSTGTVAFTPPEYWVSEYAPARAFGPIQAQAGQATLGASGMSFSIPVLTLGYSSGVQGSENSNILQISPTSQYETGTVQTSARGLELSQQLLDRSALEIDLLVARQAGLHAAVDIDVAAITAVTAVATPITNSGTAGVTTLWGDVAKASAGFMTTDGTVLPASHVFMGSTLMKWYESQIGSDGRPVWMPAPGGLQAKAGPVGSSTEGYTGFDALGAAVYEDNHIPNTSGNSTVLVGDFRDGLVVARAEPVLNIYPEFAPATLTAIASYRQYFGVAVLYPSAFAMLSGSAYPASPSFA